MLPEKPPDKIGLWTCTALVVGNMIGSGVFLLPATLSMYGTVSLFGWIGSSVGAIVLAVMFSNLSKMVRNSMGGPYAYTREGMGDFAAFLVAWGYWISIWCTNAAIAVTFVSYLTVFFPILATNSYLSVGTGLSAVWFLTWINTIGVSQAGKVQLVTTILKIAPLILIAAVGIFYVDVKNFTPMNVSGGSSFSAITASATLTLFAFLGLESATIPSANIENPEKTIPRATIIGTAVTILVYVVGSTAVMGMISAPDLQKSNAPFADAAAMIWGDSARYWVAVGAIVSTFGALNGWILLQGQMPLAASKDKLFPAIFGKENRRGMPGMGLVISSVLITLLMFMNFTKGLTDTFTFMILMTTVTVLIAYLFSASSYGIMILQQRNWRTEHLGKIILAVTAFAFSMWAFAGSSEQTMYWGFLAILAGIPFYIWMKRARA